MAGCPPINFLKRLLAEALNDHDRTLVETHVEQCPRCQDILHKLTLDAALPGSRGLLSPKKTDQRADPRTEALFDSLKRMKAPAGPDAMDDERTGVVQVDGYEVLEELGRGAVGVVYRARHLKLNRFVALKVIVAGSHLSQAVRQRFQAEGLAIARLKHPNIVQVYDVGEHAQHPFLSLELIEGGSLAEWLAGKPRHANEAARIVATLANAVEYAHRQGVVHRDLKPGNVLLGLAQGPASTPELKIADFGIAKVLSQGDIAEARMTQAGEILGTPAYMAPEQARGNPNEICPATDVYSLGAMLYEMLTGRPPFQAATALDTLVQAARQDPVSITMLVPKVPRDLNTICLKCLAKEPARRYPSAAELAADLERYLRNEPIRARPLSWVGQTQRWVRRHQGLAAALAGVAFLLVLLTIGSLLATVYFRRLEHQQATLALEKGKLADEKEIQRGKAVRAEQHEAGLRQQAEAQSNEIRHNLYLAQMNLGGQAAMSPSGIGRVQERLWRWESMQPDLRDWEWYYLNALCHRDLMTLRSHLDAVICVAWSPDGRKLASAGADGVVGIWDAADGREIVHLSGHGAAVFGVAWSPDSQRVASASWDRSVRTWNAVTGAPMLTLPTPAANIYSVAWSPDGTRLASGDGQGAIQVCNADTGATIHVLRGHKDTVFGIAWSPDGARLASAGQDNTVRLWDAVAGKEGTTLRGHTNWVRSVAWNRDGSRLASASNDQTLKIWDPSAGREILTLAGHVQEVTSVAWSPDSSRLVSGSDDQTLKVWRTDTGAELYTLRGHTYPVASVAWSPDGTRLASGSYDTTIKVWDAAAGPELLTLPGHNSSVNSVAWCHDGQRLASASFDKTVKVWDVPNRRELFTFRGHSDGVRCAAWSPDGRWLASAGEDRTIRVWDATTAKELTPLRGHTGEVYSLAWAPDSRRLASASKDRTARIWDALNGTQTQIYNGHESAVRSVAWSPDGQRLISGDANGEVKMWAAGSGAAMLTLMQHSAEIKAVAWSPDGQRLAAASVDQTITISSAWPGKLLLTLRGHTGRVTDVAWAPNNARLASASEDKTIKIWDAVTGKETLTLECPNHVYAIAWSPDGMRLASGGNDQTVSIHDATAGYAAALSPLYLPVLDGRIADDPANAANWQFRARIHAAMLDWDDAQADLQHYLAIRWDQRWCVTGCWVAGPYPEDLNAHYPPEASPDPAVHLPPVEAAEPAQTFLNWQRTPLNPAGFVNFGALFNNAEHISAYALFRVYCPKQADVAVLLGSDDQVRLWLNGKQIHENLARRRALPDDDAVPATLNAGWNTFLARVVNMTGDHALYLRLSDAPADLQRVAARTTNPANR